jgi:hypothetical protein
MAYAGNGGSECMRQLGRTFAISFQQMESNALGRFTADSRHAPQRIDHADQ